MIHINDPACSTRLLLSLLHQSHYTSPRIPIFQNSRAQPRQPDRSRRVDDGERPTRSAWTNQSTIPKTMWGNPCHCQPCVSDFLTFRPDDEHSSLGQQPRLPGDPTAATPPTKGSSNPFILILARVHPRTRKKESRKEPRRRQFNFSSFIRELSRFAGG